jgi:hypothetical protein
MKQIFTSILIIVCVILQSHTSIAQNKIKANDTTVVLQVNGVATENDVPVDGIQVILFKENEQMEWDEITSVAAHDHSFSFNLLGNAYYSVEVSKPGYVTRLVSVSTFLPDDILVIRGDKFTFMFEVELFKDRKDVDDYYLDFPVALIHYNKDIDDFENNPNYTKHIKTKINEAIIKADTTLVKSKK